MARVFLLSVVLFFCVGCFGTFPMTSRIWDGKSDISDRYVVNQTAFIVMLPAYFGGVVLDLALFNFVESTHDGDIVDEGGVRLPPNRTPIGGPEKNPNWKPVGDGTATIMEK